MADLITNGERLRSVRQKLNDRAAALDAETSARMASEQAMLAMISYLRDSVIRLGDDPGFEMPSDYVGPPIVNGTITISDFSRDKTLFDSGAALGLNAASVPLSGTATAGAVIQARTVTEAGAEVTGWANVATAAGDGSWSAAVTEARSATWLRPEVRLAAAPDVAATTANRFGVGHVWALWGQSELAGMLIETATFGEALAADDMVQVLGPTGSPTVAHVTAANPVTSSVVAMANALHELAPNDKFALVFHCVAGTGWDETFDDSKAGRSWADDLALHQLATADGQSVGLASMSWFADPRSQGTTYGEVAHQLMFGRTVAGAPITFPATIDGGWSADWTADHYWGDIYDYSLTRWLPYGPHRFDITQDMQNALLKRADGTGDSAIGGIPYCRTAWRDMVAASTEPALLGLGIEPMSYLNGYANGSAWTDVSHPSRYSEHGKPRWARHTAIAMAHGSGLANFAVPVFDQSAWAADGSYFEIWSSAGPITTTRLAKGWAPLDTSFPHWTEVFGFEVNEAPAQNTAIVAGRVRVYPNGPDTRFYQGDTIAFGRGGAGGYMDTPEDFAADAWANYPIVANSQISGIEGIDLRPLPDAAILANPITDVRPPAEPVWSITSGDGAATVVSAPAAPVTPTVTAGDASATVTN